MTMTPQADLVDALSLPPEIDIPYYQRYLDLAAMDPAALIQHFAQYGASEGRVASAAALRETFLEYPQQAASVLEIGPFCNPSMRGPQVKYFDVLASDQLRARAEEVGYPITVVPDISFMSPTGDLTVVDEHFAAVVSSHCIEHQPDLIKHLNDVHDILDAGGRYFLIIPDKRYCFDHFLPNSTIADIIEAHTERRSTHRIGNVIEHRALTTHNDVTRHWQSDHVDPGYEQGITARTQLALNEVEAAKGGYIDVHAWKFTPDMFKQTMSQLNELGLIHLFPERVYHTAHGRNEFTAVLRKP